MYPSATTIQLNDEVVAQLKDIEKHGLGGQQLRILQFVVAEELAGRGAEIKEATVAVGALGRQASSFDKRKDPVVRVQALKLRESLRHYYEREQWRAAVRIDIPTGSYRPVFSKVQPAEKLTAADAAILRSAQIAQDQQTLSAFEDALKYLDKILLEYPEYPLALAMKADIHCSRAIYGLPPKPELEKAEKLAERALANPGAQTWQAYNTYGRVQCAFRNWEKAREAFDCANANRPGDIPVHPWYTCFLVSAGESDEAIRLMTRVVESVKGYYGGSANGDPASRSDLGILQILGGRLNDAVVNLESTIRDFKHSADLYLPYLYLALLREAQDDPRAAAKLLDSAPLTRNQQPRVWGARALAHGLAGDTIRCRYELTKLLFFSKICYVPAFQIAMPYIGLRNYDGALKWLRRMADEYDPLTHWLGHFPFLRHLAHLPEFHQFLAELGLSWRWQKFDDG